MIVLDDLMSAESALTLASNSISLLKEVSEKDKPQSLIVGTSLWRVDENGKPECLEAKIERLI